MLLLCISVSRSLSFFSNLWYSRSSCIPWIPSLSLCLLIAFWQDFGLAPFSYLFPSLCLSIYLSFSLSLQVSCIPIYLSIRLPLPHHCLSLSLPLSISYSLSLYISVLLSLSIYPSLPPPSLFHDLTLSFSLCLTLHIKQSILTKHRKLG